MARKRRPTQRIDPDLLAALAAFPQLDREAVLAVARGEGGLYNREGDIGDLGGGGSYGPFQLYAKGALPARYRGNAKLADQWAWSRPGIDYALRQMLSVGAGGKRGRDAVNTIIRRFERPARPDASVAAAIARLGGGGGSYAPTATAPLTEPPTAVGAQGNTNLRILQALLSGGNTTNKLLSIAQSPSGGGAASSPALSTPVRASRPNLPQGTGRFNPAELIYDPIGAYFDGTYKPGAYGGHGYHVHAAFRDPKQVLRAIAIARSLGLQVRENPYTDPVDPVHTKGSHHYKTFPGMYKGRRLGEAIDVSGDRAKLAALFRRLSPR